VALAATEEIDPGIIIYLNRLSDYLFVLARTLTVAHGVREIKWQKA
jgi:cob(I)alamin adenosyltransferase